jgi:hypothetical protein
MSRDSGLTVGEATVDLHADRRLVLRRAVQNSRSHRFEPGRHRLPEETPVPPRPAGLVWAQTTQIPAVVADPLVGEAATEQLVAVPVASEVLPSRSPRAAWLAETWNSALGVCLRALRRGDR